MFSEFSSGLPTGSLTLSEEGMRGGWGKGWGEQEEGLDGDLWLVCKLNKIISYI